MLSLNIVISAGIVFILILLAILFVLPAEQRIILDKKRKREIEEQKDWEKTAHAQERHIHTLHKEIEAFKKKEMDLQQMLSDEKEVSRKLQEKISLERGWHEKEKGDIEKNAAQIKKLQSELLNAQEEFSKEHSVHLKVERLNKELTIEIDSANEKKRRSETENIALKKTIDQINSELHKLKKENAEMLKKQNDVQWVAKTEYVSLEKKFREKESELNRVYRELKGHG
jgi:type II secretory pathway component PulM